MIDRIIDLSIRHRLVVLALAAVAAVLGWHSLTQLPVDALPEIGDRQVIVYSQWDRSPDLIDAQVTTPIVSALVGAPRVKSVRGISDFGASFVYVVFEDDTDLYWARSRTLEYLSGVTPRLPAGVRTELGPDASALGWVFQYVLVDRSGTHSLADLRAYQDWSLRYYLKSVPGVADVAAVGGLVRQYQITVDPNRLRGYGLPIERVTSALQNGNRDAGGRVLDSGGTELNVRGLGYAQTTGDLEQTLVASATDGTPIRIGDVARVGIGSEFRRGLTDLDGTGDVVSGIVIMRHGENALAVIDRVKTRLREIEPSLPPGVDVVPVYDRSELVRQSVSAATWTLIEVTATVAIVIAALLWHLPSIAVPLVTLPLAVLIAFLPLRWFGIDVNILSLAGIAIAIGALVDAAIIVVEQTHKNLERWDRGGRQEEPRSVVTGAIKQVARPSFFALLVIAVSFLPVLVLQGEEGQLFRPLAYAKSLAMLVAAGLAVTLDPALRVLFLRLGVGRIQPEAQHPITGRIMRAYEPVVRWSLDHKAVVFGSAMLLMLATIPVWRQLGTEFLPRLDEGAVLYMPTTAPGISTAEAERLLRVTGGILKEFPEVDRVLGKAGRADTATDPAPLSMLETLIILKPVSAWPRIDRWYSSWAPDWLRPALRPFTPDHLSTENLIARMNLALSMPGVSNTWSMPIRSRVEMLTTGVRAPLGLKVTGRSLDEIERIGADIERMLPSVAGTRGVFAERAGQGTFLDIRWNRAELARAGMTVEDAQAAVQYAIGGETVTTILRGRERYSVNVRYASDFRSDRDALQRVLVSTPDGRRQLPIAELADVRATHGPSMLRNEDGLLTAYVYVDVAGTDFSSYVHEADRALRSGIALPTGYAFQWTGQYEGIARMKSALTQIIPLTLLIVVILLYVSTRSATKTAIVLLAVPFSAIGAVWVLYLLGYHMSVAVWVGLIALLGIDAETGVFMLLYLDDAYERARREGRLRTRAELRDAVFEGAARRVRPKLMTVATMIAGLLPIFWSTGAGADVMKHIAAPMIGGILSSFLLELLVYPALYERWRLRGLALSG
jgi:Cu(I)/Ag(I) efflux system membrane protein CusA/SilA